MNCEDAEIEDKEYPYVLTEKVTGISDSSVMFNAEIISTGGSEVLDYGFVWDFEDPNSSPSYKISLGSNLPQKDFSTVVDYGLFNEQQQLVRAYLETKEFTVFGNSISFISNGIKSATIESFEPKSGYSNSQIKVIISDPIEGSEIKATIAGKEAVVDSIRSNKIYVRVPDVAEDIESKIFININGKVTQSINDFIARTYWEKLSDFPGGERYGAVSFTIGNKAYITTGAQNGGDYFKDLWEYDPQGNSWVRKKDFPGLARGFSVGFAINDKGYVGFGIGPNSEFYHDIWEYNPATNEWTEKLKIPEIRTLGDAYFVIDEKLHIYTQGGAFLYDPKLNQYSEVNPFNGSYRFFTTGGLSTESSGFIIAGQEPGNKLKKDFWEYSIADNSWTELSEIPEGFRDGIASFILDSKVYAGLGGIWGGDHLDFYCYDLSSNVWNKIQDFKGEKRELPISFSIGSKAYIGLGRRTRSESLNDFWRFDPNK